MTAPDRNLKVVDRDWVVIAGLTRRLVKAPTLGDAAHLFIELAAKGEIPGIRMNTVFYGGELKIREATRDDLREFAPKKRRPKMEGQIGWELPEVPTKDRKRHTGDDRA